MKHSIELYKSFIRPFLPMSKIYHHTPEYEMANREGAIVTEISSPGLSRGAITVISLAFTGKKNMRIIPRGICPGKKYSVTLDNSRSSFSLSGYQLMSDGITVTLPSSMTSELITYKEIT